MADKTRSTWCGRGPAGLAKHKGRPPLDGPLIF